MLFSKPVQIRFDEARDARPEGKGKRRWMHLATEGLYLGHPEHPDGVDFTPELFEQIVANLHRHPSYVAASDGPATTPVIPFDFHHASEMDPRVGSVPQKGAPAPAWASELEVRTGEDGKAQLWGYVHLKDHMVAELDSDPPGYQWVSVAVWPESKDHVTNEDVGAVLTSVAFTNHPFIQGMVPIAATMRGIRFGAGVWGKAESHEEAVIGLREAFELAPAATAEEITAAFDAFTSFATAGAFPVGVDGDRIVRRLRELFGLGLLATIDEISAHVAQTLQVALPTGTPAEGTEPMSAPATTLSTTKLAGILGCRDTDNAILASATEAVEAGSALDKLKSLFGSADVQSLLSDAAKLVSQSKAMEGLVAALTDASKGLTAEDMPEDEIEEETEAAMASIAGKVPATLASTLRPVIRLAIASVRVTTQARDEVDAVLAGNPAAAKLRPLLLPSRLAAIGNPTKLAAWRADWPAPSADERSHALMTTATFAGRNGAQFGGPATGGSPAQTQSQAAPVHGEEPPHLRAMSGRNKTERALGYLLSKDPSLAKRGWGEQVDAAARYLAEGAKPL